MKKDFTIPLKTLNGEPLNDEKGETLRAKNIALTALLSQVENDTPTGEEKFKRFKLAERIQAGGETNILPEEITTLKQLIGKMYLPLVVGQMYEFLDA